MKKYVTIIGILILASISTFPVYAMGHGMGGGGMMGSMGSGLMDWLQRFQNRGDYNGPADQERKQMEGLERKLESLLDATDPDIEKIRTVHGEIRGLRAKLIEKQRTYDPEARGPNSGYPSENRNGLSSYAPSERRDSRGMGYGRHMGDY